MFRARSLALCYHAVTDSWDDRLAVRPSLFGRQIAALLRGRQPGTAADVVSHSRGVLHVTFDDGLVSILEALPVLEHYAVPATVFVCGAYGDGRRFAVPELAGNRYSETGLRTLTWDELRDLRERRVEIGSHTMTHPHLTHLTDAELDRELVDAKQKIEDEIGAPCPFLAYPFGEVDRRVRAAARRCGYVAAFGLPGRPGDRFDLPRVGLYRRDSVSRALLKAFRPQRRVARADPRDVPRESLYLGREGQLRTSPAGGGRDRSELLCS